MSERTTAPAIPVVALDDESKRVVMEATVRGATAVASAAENAEKKGHTTSEFKFSIASLVFSALVAVLQELSVMPGPWQFAATLIVAAIGGAVGYANSRGKVKAAALAAAAPPAVLPTPPP